MDPKNSFAEGNMTVSATIFHIQWQYTQTSRSFNCGFGFRENVGEATSDCVEVGYKLCMATSSRQRSPDESR